MGRALERVGQFGPAHLSRIIRLVIVGPQNPLWLKNFLPDWHSEIYHTGGVLAIGRGGKPKADVGVGRVKQDGPMVDGGHKIIYRQRRVVSIGHIFIGTIGVDITKSFGAGKKICPTKPGLPGSSACGLASGKFCLK